MDTDEEKCLKDLNWNKIKKFYYVAKFGNISTAANLLKSAQSSVSAQISLLETQLGYPLFCRNLRGVTLTRKGEELFKVAEEIFLKIKGYIYDHQVIQKNGQGNGQKRKIRIATTHAIATYIINDSLSSFQYEHPHIILEVITLDDIIDIILNDVDIAIRPYDSNAQGIEQELLFTLQKRLYASPQYLKEHGEPKTPEDLKSHRIIAPSHAHLYPYADVDWILRLGMPNGKFLTPYYSSGSIECLIGEAQKGRGIIGGYEEMSIIKSSGLVNILPLTIDEVVEWYIMFPSFLKKDADITDLKNILLSNLEPQIL